MTVFIEENGKRLYEFDTAQFCDATERKDEDYDRQLVLPVERAKKICE